jgi:radical SAM superfamily enzyme YgiQ (UPF0313 family)
MDDSILKAPHRSLIADVRALYRRRLDAERADHAARLAMHASDIQASLGGDGVLQTTRGEGGSCQACAMLPYWPRQLCSAHPGREGFVPLFT